VSDKLFEKQQLIFVEIETKRPIYLVKIRNSLKNAKNKYVPYQLGENFWRDGSKQ